MSVTVAQLGARALRKLGIAIVADASRPGEAAVVSSADIAARVLVEFGIPVAEGARPASAGVVSQADIASRALRAVGVNPASAVTLGSGTTKTTAQLGTAVLLKLAVIAADETPAALDQAEAEARVIAVHDILSALDYVTWAASAIPTGVAEYYVVAASNLLAPEFGKPASIEAYQAALAVIRQMALSGSWGQVLAEAKVQEAHEALNVLGFVEWTVAAVPVGLAQAYVAMTAALLAPVMSFQQDAPGRAATKGEWDGAIADVKRAAVVRGAQARVQSAVLQVQASLNDLGLVTWGPEAIPASVADAITDMVELQVGSEFGRAFDPKQWEFDIDHIRRVSMGGPAGQALAEQKVRAVHYSLDARGRTRWTLQDVPSWAEEPMVMLAALLLAPEAGVKADPGWAMAEQDLIRIVSLSSAREPVRATYF